MSEIFDTEEKYGNPLGRVQNLGWNGTSWQAAIIDQNTRAFATLDFEHHKVHISDHYFVAEGFTLGSGDTANYLITVPNTTKYPHMLFLTVGGLGLVAKLYQGANRTGATLLTSNNSDRNSANTAGTFVHDDWTGGTTTGDLLATFAAGSASVGGRVGGGFRSEEELILKQNTKYVYELTSAANSNNISVFFTWYEQTAESAV